MFNTYLIRGIVVLEGGHGPELVCISQWSFEQLLVRYCKQKTWKDAITFGAMFAQRN